MSPSTIVRSKGVIAGAIQRSVAIISCAPPPEAYSSIALMAMAQRNGLIIETRPEQEIAWTNRVQAVCPEMPILLCTVKGPRQ